MAEYTDDDVTRLAEMLPDEDLSWSQRWFAARDLLRQGVTLPPPPPDPALVVAERLVEGGWSVPMQVGGFDRITHNLRDLFPTDALKAAAAKVQEAET